MCVLLLPGNIQCVRWANSNVKLANLTRATNCDLRNEISPLICIASQRWIRSDLPRFRGFREQPTIAAANSTPGISLETNYKLIDAGDSGERIYIFRLLDQLRIAFAGFGATRNCWYGNLVNNHCVWRTATRRCLLIIAGVSRNCNCGV